MEEREVTPDLTSAELQTLLLTGQAMSQEQDEGRICQWVCDAVDSMLDPSLVSITTTPTEENNPGLFYGKAGNSPLPESLAIDLANLSAMELPSSRHSGRFVMLPQANLPSSLISRGISHLARLRIRTLHQEFASLIIGSQQPWEPNSKEQFLLSTLANQAAVALENVRNNRALRESEEQVRLLLNSTGEAIYGVDLQGNCTFCNAACLKLLGHNDVSDLLGENMHNLIHHTLASGAPYPEEECRIYRAFREGSGIHVDDEVLWRADRTSFPTEYWSYPVRRENQLIGCVVTFVDISERKQAEGTLLQQMRELAVLEERGRIAREIHDTLAQGITAIIWQLNAAERVVDNGGAPAKQHLESVRRLARETLQEARKSVWDLQAGPLEGRTLAEALRQETAAAIGNGGIQASFVVIGDEKVLPPGVEAALLRICQEALTNTLKYASATEVAVRLTFEDSNVRMGVQDNGVGFDPEALRTPGDQSGGFGLINMRERVRLLGGDLTVWSDPGKGTAVEATLSPR